MKKYILLIAILFCGILSKGQTVNFVTDMNEDVEETSGLLYLNDKLITHNDSGGDPLLYEIDTNTGEILRTVFINNADNEDWEDLSADDNYIYIGDFGNNDGDRTDLKVYKVLISSFFSSTFVDAETIHFNYADQIDFTPSSQTNFDAETLISYHDELYIFTKNRGDFKSNIYLLPKTTGVHEISKIHQFNPFGLITGGTYDAEADAILLTGYLFSGAFIITLNQFLNDDITTGIANKYPITTNGSTQIEGIAPRGGYQFYFSSEAGSDSPPKLYNLNTDEILESASTIQEEIKLFPNPVSNRITIEYKGPITISIYDIYGHLQLSSDLKEIDVSNLSTGYYTVVLAKIDEIITVKKIIIQ